MARKTKNQSDQAYILKMVLYLIVGSQWIWLVNQDITRQIPVPVGFILGLAFAWHDHFQIDRKIEYAVLLLAMLVGFWSHVGIYIAVL